MFKKLGLGCLGLVVALVVLGVIGAAVGGGAGGAATLVATAPAAPGGGAGGGAPEATPAPAATEPPATPQVYRVGDVIQLGEVTLAVLGWSRPEGSQFARPEPGNTFVAVELLAVNQSAQSANLSTLAQMSLKDGEDRRYTTDLLASTAVSGSTPDGELLPGERIRGNVGFQVPAEATGLTFVFDSGLFTSGKIFVELGPEPASVDVPAALAGAAALPAGAVGEPIAAGDLTILINGVSSPEGSQLARPAEGQRFIVVDVSITNNGSRAASLSTMLQMKLKDAAGWQYPTDILAMTAAGGAAPEGELAPGETVRGPVGFQVPAAAEGLVFIFDGNVFGAGKVFVQLP